MPSLNGYGIGATEQETASKAAQAFITNGLSTVLKINNICDSANLSKCGIVSSYKNMGGVKKTFPANLQGLNSRLVGSWSYQHPTETTANYSYSLQNINVAAFETANGESIAVFYQPNCKYGDSGDIVADDIIIHYAAPHMCANFIFDLNGKKGPNTAGKDIGFMTVFYPSDSMVVMPIPLNKDSATGQNYENALKVCRNVGPDVRLPNREELAAMSFNNAFLNIGRLQSSNGGASTFYAATSEWKMVSYLVYWSRGLYPGAIRVRCIKR